MRFINGHHPACVAWFFSKLKKYSVIYVGLLQTYARSSFSTFVLLLNKYDHLIT